MYHYVYCDSTPSYGDETNTRYMSETERCRTLSTLKLSNSEREALLQSFTRRSINDALSTVNSLESDKIVINGK